MGLELDGYIEIVEEVGELVQAGLVDLVEPAGLAALLLAC